MDNPWAVEWPDGTVEITEPGHFQMTWAPDGRPGERTGERTVEYLALRAGDRFACTPGHRVMSVFKMRGPG